MFVQDEVGGQAGEDGFESEQDCCMGGWKMLLRPALDRKGGCGGKETRDGESDEEAGGKRDMGPSAQG